MEYVLEGPHNGKKGSASQANFSAKSMMYQLSKVRLLEDSTSLWGVGDGYVIPPDN